MDYSWFDTAVNQFLTVNQALDVERGTVIETQCNYLSSRAFSDPVSVGICVSRLGNSSVRYEVAIFRASDELAAAQGHFVHVYVDRGSRRPVPIPARMKGLLQSIQGELHDDKR